jgi:DnaJ-class molecular chaperone
VVKNSEDYLAEGWQRVSCFNCHGTGQVSNYGYGEDFYGPEECDVCRGNGQHWITPKGKHVIYPGGPFC